MKPLLVLQMRLHLLTFLTMHSPVDYKLAPSHSLSSWDRACSFFTAKFLAYCLLKKQQTLWEFETMTNSSPHLYPFLTLFTLQTVGLTWLEFSLFPIWSTQCHSCWQQANLAQDERRMSMWGEKEQSHTWVIMLTLRLQTGASFGRVSRHVKAFNPRLPLSFPAYFGCKLN